MLLAAMMACDKDLLLCDMAETYHVLDMEALPVRTLAALAAGLRPESRIRMKMGGLTYIPASYAVYQIRDALTQMYAKDENPALLMDIVLGKGNATARRARFASPEAFEAARGKVIGGQRDG